MLESLAAWVLNTYIGDYVENLSIKQLSIALLQGKLELENLPLKKDALKKLNLPIEVRSGFIGRVHLQIPVSRLKSQPWVITLDKLYLVAGPIKTKQYNEAEEKEMEWARKHGQLTAQLEQWRSNRKKKEPGYSWWSMGTSLASNIVENLQLNVKDVHLRYEDETCIPGRSFACGVIIRSLSAQSTSEDGVPMFVGPSSSNMRYKLVDLQDFSVYWDTDTVLLGELSREQLTEQLERNTIHSPRAQIFMDHEYLVEPVSAQAKMRRNVSPLPLRVVCTPRVALDITLDKFVVALSERQYRDMVLWMKEFDRYDRAYKYRKWRPTCSVHESPSKWWQFAITAQLETIHDRNHRHFMKYLVNRVRDINTYAEAFTEYLALDPRYLDDELKAQMEEVEQSWTFEEMRGLRDVLLERFSREEKQLHLVTKRTPSRWRWLRQQQQVEQGAESVKPISEQPEQDVGTPELIAERPGLFSYYFPGWTNWKAADKPPGEGEEAHAQWKIEQEIMDVLQDNAENNTLLKRDTVFAHLNFSLEKGTLKLLSSASNENSADISTETILELECDAVGMVFESRPRTKGMKFSISVGGLYLRDHITANSIMPVLVAPQIRDRRTSGGWHFFTMGSPNEDHLSYTQYGDVLTGGAGQTANLFTLMYEQNPFHSKADYKLVVKTKPLDIVCNPAAIKRVMDFFAIQHRHGLRNRDLAEVAKLHYQELKKQTQAEIKETLDQFLEGNEQVRAKRWDCELDISAPQFILAENFTDPRTMMVVFDLGHLHFRNKAAGIDPQFRPSREPSDDTDDDFVTPCSSPPTLASDVEEDDSSDMSYLLKSAELSENDLYDKIYDKYTLNLCDVQMMVGKGGREHWKYAHLKGTSPLHIVNKFTISLQLERRLLHTCDPKWPKSTLSGTVQSLVLNVNEQKIRALHTCINLLTSEVSPASSEVHVSTSQKSMRSRVKDSTVTSDSTLDIGSLYRACSKSITSIPEATAEDQQRSRLVAESRLVLMQFGIHQMSLQLQSRGRSVAEVHVGGVKANFTKRLYDMSLSFTVHSLLVADAMQTFGPDYELLIASHKNICLDTQSGSLRDSEPNSPSSPQSPLYPASPGELVKPVGTSMSTSLISIQSAVSSALQTLTNSIPGSSDTQLPEMGQGKSPPAPPLTQGLVDPLQLLDSEALIKVELEIISPICPTNANEGETLHIANVQINNLDVIANQQTLVELISFVKRVIPRSDIPSQFATFPKGSPEDNPNTYGDDMAEVESCSRWEVHADFNRLTMMMMRVVEVDGYFLARKVATATMSQAKIWATLARDMKVEGSLGGLQLVNLTPECSRHHKVFSVGHDPSMTTPEQNTSLNESLFNDAAISEKAFTFMFAKELVQCHEPTSMSQLGQNFVLSLRMASLCYTHSPQFLHEITLCLTEFREYMLVVGRSIKERATEVARNLVNFGTELGTGLSHYGSSESLDTLRRQRQRFAEGGSSQENSVDMSRHGSSQLTLFNMKLDAVLQTPVILLPKSCNSSQVLVLHLGRISVQNATLHVPTTPPLFQQSFNFGMSSPPLPSDDKILVEVRDMTIYSIDLDKQQYLEQRLSRGINQFSTPQPGGYTKTSYGTPILHNTCVELSLELSQVTPSVCVKFNVGVTDDDTMDVVFPMHTQDDDANFWSVESDEILHVEGKVVTPLRLVLSKHVYEQLLETMNNLTPNLDTPPTRSDSSTTLLADASDLSDSVGGVTHSASNISRSSSHDQTPTAAGVVGVESGRTIALSIIKVKFAMPVFNIQLTGDVGDGEEGFLDMKFQEFLVNMEKSDPYITSVNISLRSLVVKDLLERKDSKHRHLVTSYSLIRCRSTTSADNDKRFCSTSCPTSMLETPLPDMPNSLPSVFCDENVFADYAPKSRSSASAGKVEARRSISLVNCPIRSSARTEEETRKKSDEESEDEDLLVHVRVVLVDKKSPLFDTTYKKISRFVTVDFNRLDTTINLQTWVVLLDFLGMGANVDNMNTKSDDRATSTPRHGMSELPSIAVVNETGGAVTAKVNMKVDIAVASLSLLLNKSDYELAQVNVCGFTSQVTLREGNVSVMGQLASILLRDESPHARLYRERFITTGTQALNFEFFKFGTPDPSLRRDFDMSVKLRMTSVCYVHTQRFLLETLAFCQHFLQLQHLLGQMRAASAGWKVMERAVRSLRVRLDIEAGAPKILIPHSSNSTDILVVNLGTLSVSNTFAVADSPGTVREREAAESRSNVAAMTQSVYGSLERDWRADVNAESPLSPSQHNVVPSDSNSTLNSFYSALGTPVGSASTTGIYGSQKLSPPEEQPTTQFMCRSTELDPANYKCLLDIMQVVLMDIDLFAAQWRCKEPGAAGGVGTTVTELAPDLLEFPSYFVQRQEQKLLEETCKLTLQIERNLESEISHTSPDMRVDGTLTAVLCSLDLRQYQLIKGMLMHNIGEEVGEFQRPLMSHLQDPQMQTILSGQVWNLWSINLNLHNVTLELLRSLGDDKETEIPLARCDFIKSHLLFESFSDGTKDIDLVSHEIVIHDTRYRDAPANARPNVFSKILQPSKNCTFPNALQMELHYRSTKESTRFTVLLNNMRLMGVFDWLLALRDFIMVKVTNPFESAGTEGGKEGGTKQPCVSAHTMSAGVISKRATYIEPKESMFEFKLNVTDTEFIVVEDTTAWDTNAVILKCTAVLMYCPYMYERPLTCSLQSLEVFSCCLAAEDDTALSIIDPVTVAMELNSATQLHKINSPPAGLLDATSPLDRSPVLEVCLSSVNIRLSYNDIKLFLAIMDSMPKQLLQASEQSLPPRNKAHSPHPEWQVNKLKALGFSEYDCEQALTECGNCMDDAAFWLVQNATPIPSSQHQKQQKRSTALSGIEVKADGMCICFIDDCQDADVPLAELNFTNPYCLHRLSGYGNSSASFRLTGDYYNRSLSGWEPFLEMWRCQVHWQNGLLDDPNKVTVTAKDVLNLNITSVLLNLYETTSLKWTEDYYKDNVSRTSGYLSSSRRRTPFIPFALRNNTGSELWFTTVTTTPSRMEMPLSPGRLSSVSSSSHELTEWKYVKPGEEVSFLIEEREKTRHKNTHELRVHKLVVKVAGWKEVSPLSVDKVGVYFREARPEMDKSSAIFKEVLPARIVFDVTVGSSAKKLITVRSSLVVHNRLDDPMEVLLENTLSTVGAKDMVMRVNSGRCMAMPLSMVHCKIRARPFAHSLRWCQCSTFWQHVEKAGDVSNTITSCDTVNGPSDSYRFCVQVRRLPYPPDKAIRRSVSSLQQASVYAQPGHLITFMPPFRVDNLLPVDLIYYIKGTDINGTIKPGRIASLVTADITQALEVGVELENFPSCKELVIPAGTKDYKMKLRLYDTVERLLALSVHIKADTGGSLKLSVSAPYWMVNKTGLPLVFKQDGCSESAAGQFEEHELARSVTPLSFCYARRDQPMLCSMKLGKSVKGPKTVPQWCHKFSLERGIGVRQLHVISNDARPDWVYNIGIEVRQGRGRYCDTNIITFTPRYQLDNRSQYKLAFAQRHLVSGQNPSVDDYLSALPSCTLSFHWPRIDLDQLLCVRMMGDPHCCWSGGFRVDTVDSFHINMRGERNCCLFLRVDIVLHGATYFVVFTDADQMPPPYRIDNYCEVSLVYYQTKVTEERLRSHIKARMSVPYAWDEPMLPPHLTLSVPGGTSATYNMHVLEEGAQLCYENFIYIAFTATFRSSSLVKGTMASWKSYDTFVESQELVLDVVPGDKVVLKRKEQGKRSQLWRMTSQGMLQHEGSSAPRDPRIKKTSANDVTYVLDIADIALRPSVEVSLILRKPDKRRKTTQTWKFTEDGRLCCGPGNTMCVHSKEGVFGLRDGGEAVLGPTVPNVKTKMDLPLEMMVGRQKMRPGSGFLSVKVVTDGPTRVLQIIDVTHQNYLARTQSDWVLIEQERQRPPLKEGHRISVTSARDDQEQNFEVVVSLKAGVGISLVNHVPEELVYITLKNIEVKLSSISTGQILDASVGNIQVDNQLFGMYQPVLLFVTPPNAESPVEPTPALQVYVHRIPNKKWNADIYKEFLVTLTRITLHIEEKLLWKLLQFSNFHKLTSELDALNDDENSYNSQRALSAAVSATLKRYYFGRLRMNVNRITMSMLTCSQLPHDMRTIKKTLGMPLVKFENANVELDPFEHNHQFETSAFLLELIKLHYTEELKGQAAKILGSVDFLGNPLGLFNDVTEGIYGLIDGNVGGLLKSVTHGVSNSAAKVAGTLSDGVGIVAFDERHQLVRQEILRETMGNSRQHLMAGFRGFTHGLLGGLTSIVSQTYTGTMESGFEGLITGFGKGVVGTVAKPIAGVLDLASGAASAVRDTSRTASHHTQKRARKPRCCFGPRGLLPVYSEHHANAQEYLFTLNKNNYGEMFVAIEQLQQNSEDSVRVLLSSDRVYFLGHHEPNGYNIMLEVPYDKLYQCRAIPYEGKFYIELTMKADNEMGVPAQDPRKRPKVRCDSEQIAQKVTSQILYAKNLYDETKQTLPTDDDNQVES